MTHTLTKTTNKRDGARNATGRYSKLKLMLDSDLFNSHWDNVDTANINPLVRTVHFVDLFSGAGGLSVGFEQAGYEKVFSVELDNDASNTIRGNFPKSRHFEQAIEDLTEEQIDQTVGDKQISVVCGGPPCNGFSVAGLRNPKDPRNQLFREFIRVVKHLQPHFVLMENVPGILTMQQGQVYQEILRQFEEIGYPNMSVRILEVATYGAPQMRARAVFVGNRLGKKNPYPAEQHNRDTYIPIGSPWYDIEAWRQSLNEFIEKKKS